MRICAVVAGSKGGCLMTICGGSTLIYNDYVWSEASIEIQGMKIRGNMDNIHNNVPFIYCHNFTADDEYGLVSVWRDYSKCQPLCCFGDDKKDKAEFYIILPSCKLKHIRVIIIVLLTDSRR